MAEKFSITGVINVTPPNNLKQIASQIKKELSTPVSLKLVANASANQLAADVRKAFRQYPIPIQLVTVNSVNQLAADLQKKLAKISVPLKVKVTNIKQIGDDIAAYLKLKPIPVNIAINQKGVTGAAKSLQSVTKSANDSANAMENLAKQTAITIRRFGVYTLATAAFFKLNRSIREGIQEAIEFDTQFIKIRQVTKQSTLALGDLTDEVGRLSTNLGVSSGELLSASQVLAQAGFTAKQVKTALDTLAKADLSPTFDSIDQAAEGSIALLNQFGLEVEDLAPKFGSINSVAAKFAVESSDLITGIRTAGGAFAAAGGEVEELLGLFTSVRQTTRGSADSIAVGLKTISTRLQRGRTQSFLKDLGIDLKFVGDEARNLGKEGLFVGVYESIRRISSALKNIPKNDPRFAQIAEELGGFRQIDKVIPLLTEFELAERARGVAIRETDSLTKDSIIAQESLANQFAKVREEFNLLIREIGGSDSFRELIKFVLQLSSAAIKLTQTLETLAVPLTAIVGFRLASSAATLTRGVVGNLRRGNSLPAFNTGGFVPGIGSKDTIQALLTPGEYVINKQAAKGLGQDRLDILNQGKLPGFNSGGAVGNIQRFNAGGPVNAIKNTALLGGIALGPVLVDLNNRFKILEGATGATIIAVGGALLQFKLLNEIVGSSRTALKSFKDAVEEPTKRLRKNLNTAITTGDTNVNNALSAETQANQKLSAAKTAFGVTPSKGNALRLSISQREANKATVARQDAEIDRNDSVKIAAEELNIQKDINAAKKIELKQLAQVNKTIILTSTALGVLSQLANKSSENELSKLRLGDRSAIGRGREDAQAGGLAGGAAAGAAGALFLNQALPALGIAALSGPFLAVGAAAAALGYGLYSAASASEEFDKQVRLIDITKIGDDLAKALSSVSRGASSVFLQRNNVVGGVNDVRERLRNEQDPQLREDLNATIDNNITGLQEFIDSAKESSISLKQFNSVVPTDLLEFFARRTGQSFEELNKSIAETIDSQNTFNERFKESLLNNQAFEIRLRAETSLVSAIQRSVSGLDKLNSVFDQISSGNISTDISSEIGKSLSNLGSVVDLKGFQNELKEFTSFFGDSLDGVSKDSVDAAKAIQLLPNILLQLRSSGLDGSGDIIDNLRDQLSSLGLGKDIRDVILNDISAFSEGGKGDAGIIDAISKDLTGILGSISNSLTDVGSSIKEANSRINDELSQLAQGLQSANKGILDSRNRFSSTFDTRRGLDSVISDPSSPNFNRQQSLLNSQQAFETGNSSGKQLIDSLVASQERLIDLNNQLADTSDIEERKRIINLQREQALSIQKANQGLDFLADSSKRASVLEAQLNKERESRQTRRSFAERITFSTAEERGQINRNIGLARNAASAGTIDVIPESLRAELKSFLSEVGDTTLGGLGGRSGNDILDQLVKAALGSANVDPRGIIAPNASETDLTSKIESIFLESVALQTKRSEIELKNSQGFIADLNSSFDRFLSELKATVLGNQIRSTEQGILSLRGEIEASRRQQVAGSELTRLSGIDPDTLRGNFEAIQQAAERLNKIPEDLVSKIKFDSNSLTDLIKENSGLSSGFEKEGISGVGGTKQSSEKIINDTLQLLEGRYGKEIAKSIRDTIDDDGARGVIAAGSFTSGLANSDALTVKVISESIKKVTDQALRERVNSEKLLSGLANDVGGSENLNNIVQNAPAIAKIIGQLPEKVNFSQLGQEIGKLEVQLKILNQQRAALNFNTGGFVPGSGNTDTVPAMLTPGEVVLNKNAVSKYGANNLLKLNSNSGVQKFNQGGIVQSLDQSSLGSFNSSVNTFMNGISMIAQSLANIPSKIEMTGNHRVEVVINGSQVLNNIMPEISSLVKGEIKRSINRLITERFPEQGPF